MRSPTVVVFDEDGERALEMPRVQDQEPIQALCSGRPDEPLGDPIRLGCLNRRLNNVDVFGLEDGIEAAGELGIAVVKLMIVLAVQPWLPA